MITIYKYQLEKRGTTKIIARENAKILGIKSQFNRPILFLKVDDKYDMANYEFLCADCYMDISSIDCEYIESVIIDNFDLHYFEVKK
jgi:hypothetical protein